MNICAPFIRRPVMTILVMCGLFIFGIIGYHFLPINDLPNVDFPTIQISASLPGASPETMAASVATPLERQFVGIAGVDTMTSSSSLGSTQITLQFSLDRDIDGAASDVQSAISAATKQLPEDMPNAPTYRKVNPASDPILFITLMSDSLPLSLVDKYAETLLAQQISMIDGVAQVNIFGSQKYAVRIQVDPDILTARNLSIEEIMEAVQNENVNIPSGNLNGPSQTFLVQANGQLENAAAYREMVVAYRENNPIKLGGLGQILDDVENNKVGSWYNDKPAITLAIQRQPDSNTVKVVDAIKKILPSFSEQLPKAINLIISNDFSKNIRESIKEVQITLILAVILVVAVIFLFLRTTLATIIPSIALPMSIVSAFAAMSLFNFSLNNLSLLALTLAVGFVIDDAIVMLENIVRHIEQGESPFTAALNGSKEIDFTIMSMTISLAVVFVPIMFIGGIVGRLFFEFAVTICLTILLSGFISLTLTPMLCSRLIKPSHASPAKWRQKTEQYFSSMLNWYQKTLNWVLRHPRITLQFFVVSLILSGFLFYIIPKGFIPNQDVNQINAFTEADPAMSYVAMVEKQKYASDIVKKDPNVSAVMSVVGSGGASSTSNSGRLTIQLKPRAQRKLNADEVIQSPRPKLSNIAGFKVYMQNIPSIRIGGRSSKSTYQYTLQDNDIEELNQWAELLTNEISQLSIAQDVTNDLLYTGPQVQVDIKRDKASALGVSALQIENTLNEAFGTFEVSDIYDSIDTYKVILETLPSKQTDPNALSRLYVKSSNDLLVPLYTVADITRGSGPMTINHQGQIPAVTIAFNLKPGVALGQAVNAIEKIYKAENPPASLITNFQGTAQKFEESMQGLGIILFLTIVVIYIILGILYESFIHPLTILSGLPSAGIGALLMLMLFHIDLNLYSFIGIIMLTGIVKKNAIMMIDFALAKQRHEQKTPQEAIYQACLIRFRPIMMTTMAALLGALPIALSFGAGSEARRPLGLAVVGGLLVSQLLTLYITPVIYLFFENLKINNANADKK